MYFGFVLLLVSTIFGTQAQLPDDEQDKDKPTVNHPVLFFTTPLQDKLGVFKDQFEATLSCNGGSRGSDVSAGRITYRWFRRGHEIHSGGRYTLTIYGDLKISPSDFTKDNNNYQCMITDSTPEKWSLLSNTAELYLAYATGPHSKPDVIANVEEGKPFKYVFTQYQHSRYPKPIYRWWFKNRILQESNRISVSEDGNLYIAQVNQNDAGTYYLEVEVQPSLKQRRASIILRISKSASSTTHILSVFSLGPKSRTVSLKRDKEVTLECFVSGRPMPQILWKRNDRTLSSSTKYEIKDHNKRLVIKNLNVADTGKYTCAITRAAVRSTFDAIITVVDPPHIVSLLPNNQIGHIGNYSELRCLVATATLTNMAVSWYRNGVKLHPRTARVTMSSRNVWVRGRLGREYMLNASQLQRDPDGGMYQCFVTNTGGEDMKYTAIDVQTMAPNIISGPGIVYAVRGRAAWIRCVAIGSPPITFTWQKNGYAYTPPPPVGNGNNGTLYLPSVHQRDVAQYTCIARNGPRIYDMHRSTGWLEIVGAIVVVNQSSIVYVPKGSHPNIYCGIIYDKKLNITFRWYFQGVLVVRGRKEVKPDGRLVIYGAYERDQGIYRCEARSPIGNFSTTVEVKVQAPPFVTTSPQVYDIRPDSVQLRWKAGYDGNSAIIHFTIGLRYDNGTEVIKVDRVTASGDIKKYVVPGLIPSSKYEFRIRAVNSVGVGPWSYYSKKILTLEAPPSYKLKRVTGVAIADDKIQVKWPYPPKHTHNGILLGYYVAWKYAGVTSGQFTTRQVTPATTTEVDIGNLILNSPYEIKVQMFNKAGAGPFSEPIVVKTREGFPSSAPRGLTVGNVSSRSVVLEWDAPPQIDWNGELVSYNIRLWEFRKDDKGKLEDRVDVDRRTAPHDTSAFKQSFNVTYLKTDTQYVFKVSAYNNRGGGPEAGPIYAKTSEDIPSVPVALSIVETYSDTISVSWKRPREVNGVLTGYVVQYWKVGYEHDVKEEIVPGTALQAGITSLKPTTEYMFKVAAKTRIGVSPWSTQIRGKTLDAPVPPAAPSNLRYLEVNATSLELVWLEGSKGRSPITQYVVEGNNETGFANDRTSIWFIAMILDEPFKRFNTPPVNITNLRPNTKYRFRVWCKNKVGRSPMSTVSPDRRTAEAAPDSPPTHIRFPSGNANPGELLLKWRVPAKITWNSNTVRYVASFQEVGNNDEITNMTGISAQRSYLRMPLKKYTAYMITMLTTNAHGESRWSPVIIGRTGEHVPDLPPRNIRAIGVSGFSIRVTWNTVDPEVRNGLVRGYRLFYALVEFDAAQEFTELDIGNVTSYVLKNLRGYTHYDIRLLAYTKVGDGARSDRLRPYPRTLETKPGPPSQLRFPTVSAALVVLTWAEPIRTGGNITRYQVRYRARDDVSTPSVVRDTLEMTMRVVLVSDRFYVFEVRAFTSAGWGTTASAEIYTSRGGNPGVPQVPLILPITESHIASRSVTVRWTVVTRRLHPIRFFTLQFRKPHGAWQTQPRPLEGSDREVVVWGLEPGHLYTFQISSTIDSGASAFSKASPAVRTLNKSPSGSPVDVRITSPTPTQLKVSWKPPSLVDIQSSIHSYRLGYRPHISNPAEGSGTGYHDVILPAGRRQYTINGLREFTLYDLRLNAIDVTNEDLTSYTETRRTSARLPPRPELKGTGNVGPTSVTLHWAKPSSQETPILGYKAKYVVVSKRRRRRRRSLGDLCPEPEPGAAYFSNTSSQGTITNLNMFTEYRMVLYSYNSAGDSPGSPSVSVRTQEGVPGPPETFGFDGLYGTEVHLYWSAPCERNGRLRDYKLTVAGQGYNKIKKLNYDATTYKVKGLTMLTSYTFTLVATTSQGESIPKVLRGKTGGSPVKPGAPTIVRASADYNKVTITWRDGFHGNTPITKYIFESRRSSERSPWSYLRTFDDSDVHRNRTDGSKGTKWVVLRDLGPNTVYWFRIMVENEIDRSKPSATSPSVVTGAAAPEDPQARVYEKTWFISVMAVLGFLIIVLLIICICCLCRRRRRRKQPISHPAFELSLQHSDRHSDLNADDNYTNGALKSTREELPLVGDSDEDEDERKEQSTDEDEDEDEASDVKSKSDIDSDSDSDDIPTKKGQMEAELEKKGDYPPYTKPPRPFHSQDNLYGSPPPAYATFAGRGNARSEPYLEPFNDFDDQPATGSRNPYGRPPTRRAHSEYEPYDYDSSDSSEAQRLKRGDPRSSSFRRALFTGKPEPEPERPVDDRPPRPTRRPPKPMPRKYRSLEKAVNEATPANPPGYDNDDDVRIRQPASSNSDRYSNPPEYRSDSGRESYEDDSADRNPLYKPSAERSESPAPAYQSSEDSSELDRLRLLSGNARPEPEISSYSSFV